MKRSSGQRRTRAATWALLYEHWQAVCRDVGPVLLSPTPFLEIPVPALAGDMRCTEGLLDWWKTAEVGERLAVIRRDGNWSPWWQRPRPGVESTLTSLMEHRSSQEATALVWLRAFCREWDAHLPPFSGEDIARRHILLDEILLAVWQREQELGIPISSPGNAKYFLPDDLVGWSRARELHPKDWRDLVAIMASAAFVGVSDWTPVALLPPWRPRLVP